MPGLMMLAGPIVNTITGPVQRKFQLKMEEIRNKNQIANSLRQYKLNNAQKNKSRYGFFRRKVYR